MSAPQGQMGDMMSYMPQAPFGMQEHIDTLNMQIMEKALEVPGVGVIKFFETF